MTFNVNNMLSWFESEVNKIGYSMGDAGYPRQLVPYNTNGYTDCSGALTSSLVYAGAPNQGLYSTVTLGDYLSQIGFSNIYAGGTSGVPRSGKSGDVLLMSASSSMATSGGAGGHVAIFTGNGGQVASCTAYLPNGVLSMAPNLTAIQFQDFPSSYWLVSHIYWEVWRYGSGGDNSSTTGNTGNNSPTNQTPPSTGNTTHSKIRATGYQMCDLVMILPSATHWADGSTLATAIRGQAFYVYQATSNPDGTQNLLLQIIINGKISYHTINSTFVSAIVYGGTLFVATEQGLTYTVQQGDTINIILQNTGTTWTLLSRLNSLTTPYDIYVGQVLKY